MKSNEEEVYVFPLSEEDKKKLLWKSIKVEKELRDERIKNEVNNAEKYFLSGEFQKSREMLDQAKKIDRINALEDFKNLMNEKVKPVDNEKYNEIMYSLEKGKYNHAFYDLFSVDIIYKKKWDEEKGTAESERVLKIIKNFSRYYYTGK